MNDVLEKVVHSIRENPQGGESLVLYALVSTLRMEKSGYLFMLRKFRDLSAENRQLAYELIELMAKNQNSGEQWEQALRDMDAAIKG